MKYLIALILLLASPALAQQQTAPPQDPQIMIYRQLLDNANAQIVSCATQLQAAQNKIKELEGKAIDSPKDSSSAPKK